MTKHDTSTLNMDAISKLKTWIPTGSKELQHDPGNCCFLDPPGYPTYFTQSIYINGDPPRRGPTMVLVGKIVEVSEWPDGETWESHLVKQDSFFRSLYKPLPIDHPRAKAWIRALAKHLHCCYINDNVADRDSKHTVIFPVPRYKLESFRYDPRFSEEWRTAEQQRVSAANTETTKYYEGIATIDNHSAVRHVREIYPDYTPTVEEINELADLPHVGDWWERYTENFTPETCPGLHNHKHPTSGSWCQMCGWREVK